MKKYLYLIQSKNGSVINIAFYPDTPNKNYRIYLNGSDTGYRYEYLGNASRELKRILLAWDKNGVAYNRIEYATKKEIPIR